MISDHILVLLDRTSSAAERVPLPCCGVQNPKASRWCCDGDDVSAVYGVLHVRTTRGLISSRRVSGHRVTLPALLFGIRVCWQPVTQEPQVTKKVLTFILSEHQHLAKHASVSLTTLLFPLTTLPFPEQPCQQTCLRGAVDSEN